MAVEASNENPKKAFVGGFTATAGQTIKLETTPAGAEHINITVPEGEEWAVYVELRATRNEV